ncbi:MAG: ATP-binding cassette domain-containing protein [Fervidicoccaceae archaeon]|jgi:ABC-2 type transport system ATP-binding protein|nr:ATP-binding cassette domain-containing protein [Fervidicoccaceae archaeon]
MSKAVNIENLRKIYPGGVEALKGITFDVDEGEVFGLLGPNGAGKTTTLNIIATLIKPTSGKAEVFGIDVSSKPSLVRRNIGYVLQDIATDDELTGYENMLLQARLYHVPREKAEKRIWELLSMMELEEAARRKVETYSGGMRRRLELAAALIHEPKLLLLDEPTLGLDPNVRRSIWEYIRRLNKELGTTVILTTHYIEEAEELSSRVAIIDYGEIKALGSPRELKAKLAGEVIELRLDYIVNDQLRNIFKSIDGILGVTISDGVVRLKAVNSSSLLPQIISFLNAKNIKILEAFIKTPSLEDVFVELTGRKLRDEEGSREEMFRFRRNIQLRRR